MIAVISLISTIVAILPEAVDLILWIRRRFRKRKEDTRSGDAGAVRCDIREVCTFGCGESRVEYHVVRF